VKREKTAMDFMIATVRGNLGIVDGRSRRWWWCSAAVAVAAAG
jgi:hypothetical protein